MRKIANVSTDAQLLFDGWFRHLATSVGDGDWEDDLKQETVAALMMPPDEARVDHSDLVRRLVLYAIDDPLCYRVRMALLICDGHIQVRDAAQPPMVVAPRTKTCFWE